MKGLVLKDIYSLRSVGNILTMMLIFVTVIIQTFTNDEHSTDLMGLCIFGFMVTMMSCILPLAIMNQDEMTGWNKYCITAPAKRSAYVSEKFIFVLLFALFFGALNSLPSIRFMAITTGFDIKSFILIFAIITGSSLFMFAIDLPLIFRFGTKTGNIIFMLLFLILAGTAGIGSAILASQGKLNNTLNELEKADHLVVGLTIIASCAVLYALSWLLSAFIYKKKEL